MGNLLFIGTFELLLFLGFIFLSALVALIVLHFQKQSNIKRFDVRKNNVIPDGYMDELDRKLAQVQTENREWEQQFEILMGYQNSGMESEKLNDIDRAILEYEKAVAFGRSASRMSNKNYQYSVERLMILYRKKQFYDKEISLIKDILTTDLSEKDKSDFEYRLERSIQLKKKQDEQATT